MSLTLKTTATTTTAATSYYAHNTKVLSLVFTLSVYPNSTMDGSILAPLLSEATQRGCLRADEIRSRNCCACDSQHEAIRVGCNDRVCS